MQVVPSLDVCVYFSDGAVYHGSLLFVFLFVGKTCNLVSRTQSKYDMNISDGFTETPGARISF